LREGLVLRGVIKLDHGRGSPVLPPNLMADDVA
jgi:hypothetical protein